MTPMAMDKQISMIKQIIQARALGRRYSSQCSRLYFETVDYLGGDRGGLGSRAGPWTWSSMLLKT